MLDFDSFVASSRCKPLVLAEEDQPQDRQNWKKLETEWQEKQYSRYVTLHSPEPVTLQSEEEKRVTLQLEALRNKHSKPSNGNVTIEIKKRVEAESDLAKAEGKLNKSRAKYMRGYRKRPKLCPHCGEDVRRAP